MAKAPKDNKSETIILRVPHDLKIILKEMADNDNRKLGDYVRVQLMKLVNYLPKKK